MTRVLIVAPSAVVRAGLESLLGFSPALVVVGSVSNLADVRAFATPEADVLLLDLEHDSLPDDREAGMLPIVALLGDRDAGETMDVVRRGVRGVLPRAVGGEEIVAAIAAVAAGLIVVHPQVASFFQPRDDEGRLAPGGEESLTPREIEVLALLTEGAGNKEIARQLGVSEHTVKFHVGSILAKLGASSRTEAVTLGVRRGFIML